MALSSKIKVNIPDKGVIVAKRNKYTYVYKVLKTYRNEKGQPTNDRVSIGRLDTDSGKLIPNDNYWKYYIEQKQELEVLPEYNSIRSIGCTFLLRKILDDLGVYRILYSCFGPERSEQLLTAALYMACRGNVFEHVLNFCEGFTLHEKPLTSQSASSLFASLTHDERMAFFKAWIEHQSPSGYLAYDVTSFSSYALGILDAEWGYNRDNEKLPQINLGCYFSEQSGLPVFYVTYPGSILDKSHLPYMMAYNDELGIEQVGFIMDRGFCTTANIQYMLQEKLDFIMGCPINYKAVKYAIEGVQDKILSLRNCIQEGIYAYKERNVFYGVKLNIHIYFDPDLAERQRQDLHRKLASYEEEMVQKKELTKKELKHYSNYFDITTSENQHLNFERNHDKIDMASQNFGFFCLLTNTGLSSKQMLEIYRKKDIIEKCFDDLKNHIDMKRMRTHRTETTDGKLFASYISLIAVSQLQVKLMTLMREKSWSKDSVIAELEKIKIVKAGEGRRLINPITKTQRLILDEFGYTEADIKNYVFAEEQH